MKTFNHPATVIRVRPGFLTAPADEDTHELPPMPRARGTREWVKADHPLGTSWFLVYAMQCLGTCVATAGGLELAYRLGSAHRDILDLRAPPRSKVYG